MYKKYIQSLIIAVVLVLGIPFYGYGATSVDLTINGSIASTAAVALTIATYTPSDLASAISLADTGLDLQVSNNDADGWTITVASSNSGNLGSGGCAYNLKVIPDSDDACSGTFTNNLSGAVSLATNKTIECTEVDTVYSAIPFSVSYSSVACTQLKGSYSDTVTFTIADTDT